MFNNTFEVIFLIGLVAGCVVRVVCVKRARPGGRGTRAKTMGERIPTPEKLLLFLTWMAMQVIPLVYVFTSRLDFADCRLPPWASWAAGWIGAGVFAIALWLLCRSHADLGHNWSVTVEIQQDHALVTEGVYRRIRHPMYAAHLLWAIAQALLLQNWIAGPAFLVSFFPFCLLRVPREERMMLDSFAEEYRAYMKRTGRLIPRLRG